LANVLKWVGSILLGAGIGVILTWLTLWAYSYYIKINRTTIGNDDGANILSNVLVIGGFGYVLLGAGIGAWLYSRHKRKPKTSRQI